MPGTPMAVSRSARSAPPALRGISHRSPSRRKVMLAPSGDSGQVRPAPEADRDRATPGRGRPRRAQPARLSRSTARAAARSTPLRSPATERERPPPRPDRRGAPRRDPARRAVTLRSPDPSAFTIQTLRPGQPWSFHRKASRLPSGDQTGDEGAVPMRLGSPATRSIVRAAAEGPCAARGVARSTSGNEQSPRRSRRMRFTL